jgi:hypothetical protein
MSDWELGPWVVDPCPDCGAPGDVPCREDCGQKDFRDSEFAAVTDPPEWPTDEERYS